jgi:hypothetical protein
VAPAAFQAFVCWSLGWLEAGVVWAYRPGSSLALAALVAFVASMFVGVLTATVRHDGRIDRRDFWVTAVTLVPIAWLVTLPIAPDLLRLPDAGITVRLAVAAYVGVAFIVVFLAARSEGLHSRAARWTQSRGW